MTLEEAVAAYSLAFGHAIWTDQYVEGEKKFVIDLIEQLRGEYYALNVGDILGCARNPKLIAGYEMLRMDIIEQARAKRDLEEHLVGAPLYPREKRR